MRAAKTRASSPPCCASEIAGADAPRSSLCMSGDARRNLRRTRHSTGPRDELRLEDVLEDSPPARKRAAAAPATRRPRKSEADARGWVLTRSAARRASRRACVYTRARRYAWCARSWRVCAGRAPHTSSARRPCVTAQGARGARSRRCAAVRPIPSGVEPGAERAARQSRREGHATRV